MASTEQLKDFYRRWFEDINTARKPEVVDKYTAADFVEHTPGLTGAGVETARKNLADLLNAFPDLYFTIEAVMAEGENVAGRVRMRATHTGTFQGIAPTGATVNVLALEWGRVREEQWVDHWVLVDALNLMQQLGFAVGTSEDAESAGG